MVCLSIKINKKGVNLKARYVAHEEYGLFYSK